MEMPTDDELYRVDDVFLGPPGMTLPFRARYRALGIGAVATALVMLVEVETGTVSVIGGVWALFLAYAAATLAMRHLDFERTIRSTVRSLYREVRAPRGRPADPVVVFRPGRRSG